MPLALKAAVLGFALHTDVRKWGADELEYVNRFLEEGPRLVDLNRVPGGEAGYGVFMALCLGRLCGQHVAGELDTEGVARGEWALVTFLGQHKDLLDLLRVHKQGGLSPPIQPGSAGKWAWRLAATRTARRR